jgi:hypothetical protein
VRARSGQWDEWECPLTGASVGADCGAEDFGEGECVPQVALAVMEGRQPMPARGGEGGLAGPVRLAMAQIRERRRSRVEESGFGGKGTMTEQAGTVRLEEMSPEELLELITRARKITTEKKRAVARTERQRLTLLPKLRKRLQLVLAKRKLLEETAEELSDQIEGLVAGMPLAHHKGTKVTKVTGAGIRRYTPEEDQELLELQAEGLTARQIGERVGRARTAVYARLAVLKKRARAEAVHG